MSSHIFGHSWEAIQRGQQGGRLHETINLHTGADYGADPMPDGQFRMVPSGDIVNYAERCKRLGQS